MAFYATHYTIHFDDTMAYGSHHFLTAFKFQCAARESFLFGERVFDVEGVREALDGVHLFTSDAYARNLSSAKLGDRLTILLTLEDWGRASARFCYRVVGQNRRRIMAGFQTLVCADAKTGTPIPMPKPLRNAMDTMRQIEEIQPGCTFREAVLAGGSKLDALFDQSHVEIAAEFLTDRYPQPTIIAEPKRQEQAPEQAPEKTSSLSTDGPSMAAVAASPIAPINVGSPVDMKTGGLDAVDASKPSSAAVLEEPIDGSAQGWMFAGQGGFDAAMLCRRIESFLAIDSSSEEQIRACVAAAKKWTNGDVESLFSGKQDRCEAACRQTPMMTQIGIHLQNVLGGLLCRHRGYQPIAVAGHSFGEIAALSVAGCFDLPTGVEVVCSRAAAIERFGPRGGGLMVMFADRQQIKSELSLLGFGDIVIAGRNHQRQTIVSGPVDRLKEFGEQLRRQGVRWTSVPSPTSFHHPVLRDASAAWLKSMRSLDFQTPSIPVFSPIGRHWIAAEDDIAAELASQLLRPFDLQGAVVDLLASGVTSFVDCGSTGSLARLIMQSCGPEVAVHAADSIYATGSIDVAKSNVIGTQDPAAGGRRLDRQSVDSSDSSIASVPAVAIVAQGCILPGGSKSPSDLYDAISSYRSGIVDQRRFDPDWEADFFSAELVPDRTTSPLTGRVNDEDIVCPVNVDGDVFHSFTRSQKLLCLSLAPCVDSIRDAKRVWCLVGGTADGFEDQDLVSSLRYADIDPSAPDVDARLATAGSDGVTPHQAIQEVFDKIIRPGLRVTLVDAACASSLYTMTLGVHALENNQVDAVIAGGCFCPGPGNSCLFAQFTGTTSTGCRPFDQNADGVVFSEGSALVVLRRTADAKRAALAMPVIVRGVGLSSDGKSSSANVPQTKGQIISLERCYRRYQIDRSSITAIEAHGTSTPVGDSTELRTLQQFFDGATDGPIAVHSLKGTLGHAGWAAGTTSVIAACEYMRRREFPAQSPTLQPSKTLQDSAATLVAGTEPLAIKDDVMRLAVDGFGFGGANAHVVLEGCEGREIPDSIEIDDRVDLTKSDRQNDLVIVSRSRIRPDDFGGDATFDRDQIGIPKPFLVLPELADDLDISQRLAVHLCKNIVDDLPTIDENVRRETSVILAMSGKTERGIEATTRILTPRFRRRLADSPRHIERVENAAQTARPSGAYTLQCMMPNVASGRASLLLNLNGPNFVVDSGRQSIADAFDAASLIVCASDPASPVMAIVAAIDACSGANHGDESAAAFAVTTRAVAARQKWEVIEDVSGLLDRLDQTQKSSPEIEQARLIDHLFDQNVLLQDNAPERHREAATIEIDADANPEIEMYTPVWVEQSIQDAPSVSRRTERIALVSLGDRFSVDSIAASLRSDGHVVELFRLDQDANGRQLALDDESDAQGMLKRIDAFAADVVLAVDEIMAWDLDAALGRVASENQLTEWMFLIAKALRERLASGEVSLWSVFKNGFRDDVHPRSGGCAGLFKSLQRELPNASLGCLSTGEHSWQDCLARWSSERNRQMASSSNGNPSQVEIAYNGDRRMVRRLCITPSLDRHTVSDGRNTAEHHSVTLDKHSVTLDKHSVVVASAGAKGVTATMLEAIAADAGCTIIALGRSELIAGPSDPDDPQVETDFYRQSLVETPGQSMTSLQRKFRTVRAGWEAANAIERFKAAGANVHYRQIDVADQASVDRVIGDVVSQFGRIDLVLHGAGVQFSKRLEDRSLAEFRLTYDIKVGGLNGLHQACQKYLGRAVAIHVLTSAYSVFGNDGQHDYGAANETMDRVANLARRDGGGPWSSIAWLAWDAVGMTRGSEYRALAKQRQLSGVNVAGGQRLFRDVITGRTGVAINVPVSAAERNRYAIATVPNTDRCVPADMNLREVPIDISQFECLSEHLVRDTPTLPGAWIIEQMVAAAQPADMPIDRAVDVVVEDTSLSRFVRLSGGKSPNVRLIVESLDNKSRVKMIADVLHPSGVILEKDVLCATAVVSFVTTDRDNDRARRDALLDQSVHGGRDERDPYCQSDAHAVRLSGAFDCLSSISIAKHHRRGRFTSPHRTGWNGRINALLLDASFRMGAMHAAEDDHRLFVPVTIKKLTMPYLAQSMNLDFAASNGSLIHSTNPKLNCCDAVWDETVVIDPDGAVALRIEGAAAKSMS